jgi:hypothetical protein
VLDELDPTEEPEVDVESLVLVDPVVAVPVVEVVVAALADQTAPPTAAVPITPATVSAAVSALVRRLPISRTFMSSPPVVPSRRVAI